MNDDSNDTFRLEHYYSEEEVMAEYIDQSGWGGVVEAQTEDEAIDKFIQEGWASVEQTNEDDNCL